MSEKIKIKALNKRDQTTKFGDKQIYDVVTEDGREVYAWVGRWNSDWAVGQEVEAEVSTDNYGKLVAKYAGPKNFGGRGNANGGGGFASSGHVEKLLAEIKAELVRLNQNLAAQHAVAPPNGQDEAVTF